MPATPDSPRPARKGRAQHSLEQIVETAIALLDTGGPKGLTLRALATELGGGLGSVYWYVQGKDEVLALVCEELIARALHSAALAGPEPRGRPADPVADPIAEGAAQVRRYALALFDQTQAHPWLAAQMQMQGAGGLNALRFWEALGRPLAQMGLTPRQQFHGSTAISGYVTGVAAEMSAQDLTADIERSKEEQLGEIVDRWLQTDPEEFAWIHSIGPEFRTHDDTEQFTAGLDLLLSGLAAQARP